MLVISTVSGKLNSRVATESEATYLDQVVELDGPDAIVSEEPVTNGSGRIIGRHVTISDDDWEFIQESVRRWEAEHGTAE